MQNEKLINAIFEAHKMGFEEVVKKIAMQNPNALIQATLDIEVEVEEEETVQQTSVKEEIAVPTPSDDNVIPFSKKLDLEEEKEIEQRILKDFKEYEGLEDIDDFVLAKFESHELKTLAKAIKIGKIYLEKARNAKIDDKQWTPKYEKFAKWMSQYKINDYMTKVVWFNITEEKAEKTPEQQKQKEDSIKKLMELY